LLSVLPWNVGCVFLHSLAKLESNTPSTKLGTIGTPDDI
jgi:hypothetical protein